MNNFEFTTVGNTINYALQKGYSIISEQGSSRSGKTYNTMAFLICYLVNHPNTRLSVVRATLPALKGSVYVDFKEIMNRFEIWEERRMNKSSNIYEFTNGSVIEFFSCDSEQKLRGRKRDVLFVNEANELKFIEWQQLKMRTSRFTILDYNPSFTDDHWINDINRDPNCYHYITTYKDNPFIEQTIIDEIESLQWKNETLWRVYGLGLQAMIEGLIFENVDYVKEFPECKKVYIGVDYGYAHDPTAIVRVGFRGNDVYVEEICYKTQMLIKDIVQTLKENCPKNKIISESADPRLIDEIFLSGLNIHAVHKYGGSIEAGITKMLEYKIHVTKDSHNVMKEFKNYTYMQNKEGKFLNTPIDCYNHAIDAIRYIFLNEVIGTNRKPINKTNIFNKIY